MAQTVYRANLSARGFPFLSENFGRSVIVPYYDQNFNRQVVSPEDSDKDVGIPQVYYCENVLPTPQGFAVPFAQLNTNSSPFDISSRINYRIYRQSNKVVLVYGDAVSSSAAIQFTHRSKNSGANAGWSVTTSVSIPGLPALNVVFFQALLGQSIFLNGYTYIFLGQKFNTSTLVYGAISFLRLESGGVSFTVQEATGLTAVVNPRIISATTAGGYMIVAGNSNIGGTRADTIYYSSLTDPLDFTPSATTGAGFIRVREVQGDITHLIPARGGFYIFSTLNAVFAAFTGNTRAPFAFRAVPNCGGIPEGRAPRVAQSAENTQAFVIAANGLLTLSGQEVDLVSSDFLEYITGRKFETFAFGPPPTFSTVRTAQASQAPLYELNFLCNRYLVISFNYSVYGGSGAVTYTHALIYDYFLKRWGRLKIDHEMVYADGWGSGDNIDCLAFYSAATGNTTYLLPQHDRNASENIIQGVLLLGKYQFNRAQMLSLQKVELENSIKTISGANGNCVVYDFYSLDGKNTVPVAMTEFGSSEELQVFLGNKVAKNHSVLIYGQFNINSLVLTFTSEGRV